MDRMFREMEEAGLPAPEYRQNEFMVYATIRQHRGELKGGSNGQLNGQLDGPVIDTLNGTLNGDVNDSRNDGLSDSVKATYLAIKANPGIQRKGVSAITGKSVPTIDRHIAKLFKEDLIEHRDSDKTVGYYAK